MTILFVTENLGSGGAERQLTGLAALLAQRGHQCTVVTWIDKDFYESFLAENGVRHMLLHPSGRIDRVRRLAGLFRSEKPDAVIAFLPCANETAALASLLTPVKLIVSERSFTTNWGMRRCLTNLLYHRAAYVVANSNNEARNIRNHCSTLASRTIAIPNYVDVNRFVPVARKCFPAGSAIAFVGVGRVIPSKNLLKLVRALAIVKGRGISFTFDWFGSTYDTAYTAEVIRLAASIGLDKEFTLRGECPTIEFEYRRADIMCMPSTLEGYPNVLVEAMASGLPVVVSNVCEHPHIVTDGVNGFLFDPENVDAIADALTKAARLGSAQAAAIAMANREKVLKNNSIDAFINRYLSLITDSENKV